MKRQFPDSVKLICEAGTGYNNIDLDAAKGKKITVCNIPSYSSKRVAHTAITITLFIIYKSLIFEVNGKTLGVVGVGYIGKNVIKIAQALDIVKKWLAQGHELDKDHLAKELGNYIKMLEHS